MPSTLIHPFKYCPSLTEYKRFQTREVVIGDIAMGGNNPIRIQSMTTTDTMNTIGTVEQSIRIWEAGGEYVRITAPSKKEAHNLANIKAELKKRGYDIPLIADIHFTPNAAEIAARIVEKVRVNPGNYADKKKFQVIEYSDQDYKMELERIYERFAPLVKICKEEGTVMRIGTNHGSLSDRIMSRYGDSPVGMVESALEFVRICEDLNYHNLVLSMKASNAKVMVQAYRLLVNKMLEEGMHYPLHLGVTEAGDGMDGRIKSAVGIGALLEDGLGDTVRVSLTEAPEAECPVAIDLVDRYKERAGSHNILPLESTPYNPYEYQRRKTRKVNQIGKDAVPVFVADMSDILVKTSDRFKVIGYEYKADLDKWNIADQAADFVFLQDQPLSFEIPGTLQRIHTYNYWKTLSSKKGVFPLLSVDEYKETTDLSKNLNFISVQDDVLLDEILLKKLKTDETVVLVVESKSDHWMPAVRRFFSQLITQKITCPVLLKNEYSKVAKEELALLYPATDFGSLLLDGMGDGLWMSASDVNTKIAFGILQATRTRISKTEYISCPSCGRTLFDLEETTAMIRERTHHLKGVKIGIMGCIVNGPGEMADADYGYVGSGVGKITLYRSKEVVKRNIPSEEAVDQLIEIIREDGNWVEMV